ncbi:cytochrome P450 [Nocardia sp. NPDC051030]|uniref:cytochrome P450 n=1 Tax=Nocardia sp. NPDC051030 TaxID=3155162 RepID=UPI003433A4FC
MTTTERETELPDFPIPRGCPFAAPPIYDQLRTESPISRVRMRDGESAWLLTRHEDVRAVLSDPRFSANKAAPGFPVFMAGQKEGLAQHSPFLVNMDGDAHTAARRPLISEFSTRRINLLRPRIQQIVDELIDRMLTLPRPLDLVGELALPIPSSVIAELVGVSDDDFEFFQQITVKGVRRETTDQQQENIAIALRDFMTKLVEEKEVEPGDDLVSRQISQQRAMRDDVDRSGLVSMAILMLIAGHETTANMISLGVYTLLSNPDQLAAMAAAPDKVPAAVEELLRYYSIIDFGPPRLALEDVEVGGVLIKAGEGVIASGFAAGRDGEIFADPEKFDIDRDARLHVAFGYGAHQCLGQNLARAELQITLETLFRRIPELRLAADPSELRFKSDALVYGLHELPVTW